jgi:hypothetical protein
VSKNIAVNVESYIQVIGDVDCSSFVCRIHVTEYENSHRRSTAGLALGSGCATEALGS